MSAETGCATCGKPTGGNASIITNDGIAYYCHGLFDESPTCYELATLSVFAQGTLDAENARNHDSATCEDCQRRRFIMGLP